MALSKALENGYKLDEFYEVRQFDKSSNILFKEYINAIVSLKLQAF